MRTKAPDTSPDTKQRLLIAAVKVFAANNFEGASIRDIARLANANSALIQYHFGGKEGLYLEAVKFVFRLCHAQLQCIQPPPPPSDPKAREKAVHAIYDHVRAVLRMACIDSCELNRMYGPDFQKTAFTLWNQALRTMRPHVSDFIQEVTSVRREHLQGCIAVLLPHLSEEEAFRMEMSIMGQVVHLHNRMELVKLHRGKPYGEEDLDSLVEHYARFSLRGMGVPESLLGHDEMDPVAKSMRNHNICQLDTNTHSI